MKQQSEPQNLWLLWIHSIRAEIACIQVTDLNAKPERIRELQDMMLRIYPLVSLGVHESS